MTYKYCDLMKMSINFNVLLIFFVFLVFLFLLILILLFFQENMVCKGWFCIPPTTASPPKTSLFKGYCSKQPVQSNTSPWILWNALWKMSGPRKLVCRGHLEEFPELPWPRPCPRDCIAAGGSHYECVLYRMYFSFEWPINSNGQ